jgi:hypothetical protein
VRCEDPWGNLMNVGGPIAVDLNMIAVESGDYVGIVTSISWMNAAACIRFNIAGPWTCSSALSFINSMNVAMPPYACTHNP